MADVQRLLILACLGPRFHFGQGTGKPEAVVRLPPRGRRRRLGAIFGCKQQPAAQRRGEHFSGFEGIDIVDSQFSVRLPREDAIEIAEAAAGIDEVKEGPLLAAVAVQVQQAETGPLLDLGPADSDEVADGHGCARRHFRHCLRSFREIELRDRPLVEGGHIESGANGGRVARHDGLCEGLGEGPGFGVAGRPAGRCLRRFRAASRPIRKQVFLGFQDRFRESSAIFDSGSAVAAFWCTFLAAAKSPLWRWKNVRYASSSGSPPTARSKRSMQARNSSNLSWRM